MYAEACSQQGLVCMQSQADATRTSAVLLPVLVFMYRWSLWNHPPSGSLWVQSRQQAGGLLSVQHQTALLGMCVSMPSTARTTHLYFNFDYSRPTLYCCWYITTIQQLVHNDDSMQF